MDNNADTGHWTQRTSLLLSPVQMRAVRSSHVMIFGLGGVGSYAAEALGRMGVGTLTIVDKDHFVKSNINRQLGALVSTVGMSKAEVTRSRLLDINPEAEVIAVEQFHLPEHPVTIAEDVSMVIDAIDTVAAKLLIAETCYRRNIPLISAMGMGNRLDPTQVRIGDLFDTHTCALCRVMRKELRKRMIPHLRCVYSTEEAAACGAADPQNNARRSVPGSVSYVPAVAGLYLAYDVIQTLIRQTDERKL